MRRTIAIVVTAERPELADRCADAIRAALDDGAIEDAVSEAAELAGRHDDVLHVDVVDDRGNPGALAAALAELS